MTSKKEWVVEQFRPGQGWKAMDLIHDATSPSTPTVLTEKKAKEWAADLNKHADRERGDVDPHLKSLRDRLALEGLIEPNRHTKRIQAADATDYYRAVKQA